MSRNSQRRTYRRVPQARTTTTATTVERPNYDRITAELVARGLCSPAALDGVPLRRAA